MTNTEKRTVAVAGFPYKRRLDDGTIVYAFATRGQEVVLHDAADIERGDRLGFFLKPGETVDGHTGSSLDELGLLTDDQLLELYAEKPPKVADLLKAVGDDPGLAQRILDAEAAAGHDRKSLVEALTKLIGSGD